MAIVVESRRKKLATVERLWPDALVLDLTSKGPEPWLRFSPFYPHGDIPIPNSHGATAQSVEGLWQGLKVFEREDVDPRKWAILSLSGIKRSSKSRGAVRGHRFGIASDVLLGYREARYRIYLPAYRWVLENHLVREVAILRKYLTQASLILLDYETNGDVEDLSRPLSHAALVKYYLEASWPVERVRGKSFA
jgi:hypothetical protein